MRVAINGCHGYEYSYATGPYNFRARWYDPITGRWLSKDPIGISGGLNQYAFVENNPVNYTDPLGLVAWGQVGRSLAGIVGNVFGVAGGALFAVATSETVAGAALGGAVVLKSSYGISANAQNLVAAFRNKSPVSKGTLLNDVAELTLPGNQTAQRVATATDIWTEDS